MANAKPKPKLKPAVKAADVAKAPEGTKRLLKVKANGKSFWRAGIKFTCQEQLIPLGDLSEAQIEAITNEPELSVEIVDQPKEKKD